MPRTHTHTLTHTHTHTVDRGAHSVEVVTYLLAQKLISPSKVKLLRGNHETRIQNAHSGYNPCFKDSCVQLFGMQVQNLKRLALIPTFRAVSLSP